MSEFSKLTEESFNFSHLMDHEHEGEVGQSFDYLEVLGSDTIPASTATGEVLAVNSTLSGYINTNADVDWVRIDLVAGRTYQFMMIDTDTSLNIDSYLRLRNSAGTVLSFNDDNPTTVDSLITYTASTSGTYYLSASSYNASSYGGYTLSAYDRTEWSTSQIATQLTDGYWNASGRVRHSFAPTNTDITFDVSGISVAHANLARLAFQTWADVSGLTFTEVTSGAEINFTNNSAGAYASASYTGNTTTSALVNINSTWNGSNNNQNSYTFQTFIHEIGHVLGLGHAGNYNGSALYGYHNNFLNDSWQASVMSYFAPTQNTTLTNVSSPFVMTPQMADIYAIQQLYGVGQARTGDTTYGFGSNAGAVYNLSGYSSAPAFTIYDTGGYDTLNFSGYSQNQLINLNAGAYSNIGGNLGNVGIYLNSIIEAAIGGTGNDTITGNTANNNLAGGAGNDSISGGDGDDILIGGIGADRLIGGNGDDWFYIDGTDTLIQGGAGYDRVMTGAVNGITLNLATSSVEFVFGNAFNDIIDGSGMTTSIFINGDLGNDIITGGSGDDVLGGSVGIDQISGGDGDDWLYVDGTDSLIQGGNGYDRMFVEFSTGLTLNLVTASIEFAWGGYGNDNFDASVSLINGYYRGGYGNDTIMGGSGSEWLIGDEGWDILSAGAGNDALVAGDTDLSTDVNVLTGGAGYDWLYGGTGQDTFVLSGNFEVDRIFNFTTGVDKIRFEVMGANSFSDIGYQYDEVANITSVWYAGNIASIDGQLTSSDFIFV